MQMALSIAVRSEIADDFCFCDLPKRQIYTVTATVAVTCVPVCFATWRILGNVFSLKSVCVTCGQILAVTFWLRGWTAFHGG